MVTDVTITFTRQDIARIVANRLDDNGIDVLGYSVDDETKFGVAFRIAVPAPFTKFHCAEAVSDALNLKPHQVLPHADFDSTGI